MPAPLTLPPPSADPADDAVARVQQALRGLRFGEVRIIVHDGEVVQIDRTERTRIDRRSAGHRPDRGR